MPEPAGRGLVDGGDVGQRGQLADHGEELRLAAGGELGFEVGGGREVRGAERVAGAGDQDDAADPGAGGFLDAVLDDGAVDEGQQLLGDRPGRGQHARAEPGRRHEDIVDGAVRRHADPDRIRGKNGRIRMAGRCLIPTWCASTSTTSAPAS